LQHDVDASKAFVGYANESFFLPHLTTIYLYFVFKARLRHLDTFQVGLTQTDIIYVFPWASLYFFTCLYFHDSQVQLQLKKRKEPRYLRCFPK